MSRRFSVSRIEGLFDQKSLTAAEVAERQHRFGRNIIIEAAPSGWRDVVQNTVRDPMIWFLIGTALLFVWLGNFSDALVLSVALLPIMGMDAYLHQRTMATTEGLKDRLASQARVIRDGVPHEIAAVDLVPGDIVLVAAGTPFPADGIITGGEGLQVDESALTGEAMPVRKQAYEGFSSHNHPMPHSGDITLDGIYWCAAGTRLLTGEARVRLIYTGSETIYGQIAQSAQAGKHERTPLQQAINGLVTVLVVIAAILCVALAAIRFYQGYGVLDAVLSAVTLAIAALPEEFPIVFTFFLGVGVYRLARRQALVRRAVVVENIGRITCICTDKTGTLTEGKLHLAHIIPADGMAENNVTQIAVTAARVESGDPLDILLHDAMVPMDGTRLETFPFTEDRRREVAIVRDASGIVFAAAKGAPETILSMVGLDDKAKDMWLAKTRELATSGHKVIACALHKLEDWQGGEPDRGYDMVGLLAFEDPVREGVAAAITRAKAAGIRIIMVTGDHPDTARAIAKELRIGFPNPHVIEGADLSEYLEGDVKGDLAAIDVIARAIPSQKLDLVRALQHKGEIVAVTGDGVNDVPALQGADVGIAMGERGTSTAREVASIILLDDNFRTIVRAIAEGRQLFLNLKLSFAYLLMIHVPLVATAALIPLFGFPLLYLPVHIVWLELIIHPTALLVFQQLPSSEELGVIERHRKIRFFNGREWAVIGLVGGLITLLILFGYYYSLENGLGNFRDIGHARSMAMVALIIASATVTAALSGLRSTAAVVIVLGTISSAVIIIQFQALAGLMHMSPLHGTDWLISALGGVFVGGFSLLIPVMQRGIKWRFSSCERL